MSDSALTKLLASEDGRWARQRAADIGICLHVSSMRHVDIELLFYSGRAKLVIRENDGRDREYPVDQYEAESVREEIAELRPATIPPNVAGIDGVIVSLRVETGENSVEWTWFDEPPDEWLDLGRVAQRLIALATPRLEGPLIEGP